MGCTQSKATTPAQTATRKEYTATTDVDTSNAETTSPQHLLSRSSKDTAPLLQDSQELSPPEEQQQRPKKNAASHPTKSRTRNRRPLHTTSTASDESSGSIKPTKLNSAESQRFKQHLETSLKARGQKHRVTKDVARRHRSPPAAKRSTVVDYKQRLQITVQPDNASAHSKQAYNGSGSQRSLGLESTGHESAASFDKGTQHEESPHRRQHRRKGSTSGQPRSSSKQRRNSSSRRSQSPRSRDKKARIPPNNARSKTSSKHPEPRTAAETSEPRPEMRRSASTRRRKEPRKRGSKSPSSARRNSVSLPVDKEKIPLPLTAEGFQPTPKDKVESADLDISGSTSGSAPSKGKGPKTSAATTSSGSPKHRQRRRNTVATNQRPRVRHDKGLDGKVAVDFKRDILSSNSFPDRDVAKDSSKLSTTLKKSPRDQQTGRKKAQALIPPNEPRTTTASSGSNEAQYASAPSETNTTPEEESLEPTEKAKTSGHGPSSSLGAELSDKEPIDRPIEGLSQHSLGPPSQHSLDSYLPEVMKRDSVSLMKGDGVAGGDLVASQNAWGTPRSAISDLVKKINPIKKTPEFEGGVPLSDSERSDLGDGGIESSAPQVMAAAFNQIISRPLLSRFQDHSNHEKDSKAPEQHGATITNEPVLDGDMERDNSSASLDPVVFKFDASDPTVAQFDPAKGTSLNDSLHSSLSTVERIHRRKTLRGKRTEATRHPGRDGLTSSLHSSCSQLDVLKAEQLSPVGSKNENVARTGYTSRTKASRRRSTMDRNADSSTMKDGSMKDHSSATTSSNRSRERRRRNTHSPSSPRGSPTTPPSKGSHRQGNSSPRRARRQTMKKRRAVPALKELDLDD